MRVVQAFVRKKPEPDEAPEQTFTAYIFKGNRQVVKRTVIASKRFKVDDETYVIKPNCIFLKNVDGFLRPVSYYREGNPNPYDFTTNNSGLTAVELDRLYAEDFYHIVTALQPENRMKYVLLVSACTMAMSVAFVIIMAVKLYV